MKRVSSPGFPRPLSPREKEIAEWLIINGEASKEEKMEFLAQLQRATVIRRCPCGCASIDLAIDGREPSEVGMIPFGDFITPGSQYGIFVFSRGGILAGVEIYQLAADSLPAEFPRPVALTPYDIKRES